MLASGVEKAGRSVIPAKAGIQPEMEKQFAVYIMASHRNGTLYVGVTSNLPGRAWQHREGVVEGFSKKHGVKTLVWFEMHENADSAIVREKRIKKWNRLWKLSLIEASNPAWEDLSIGLV